MNEVERAWLEDIYERELAALRFDRNALLIVVLALRRAVGVLLDWIEQAF